MRAIVTIKFDNIQPERDAETGRIVKVVGICPVDRTYCSDVYGKHHSYIEEGIDLQDIERKAHLKFSHVTRIEIIENETVGELYRKYKEGYIKAYGEEPHVNDHGGW